MIIKCDNCGIEFEKPKNRVERSNRHFCSVKCRQEGHKKFDDMKLQKQYVELECFNCGKHFTRHAKIANRNKSGRYFCSKKCQAEVDSVFVKGEKHPNWTGGKPHCIDCGIELTTYQPKRCTACFGKYYSEKYNTGASSLQVSIRNLTDYKEWRKSVFVRDDFTCQNCGKTGGYLEAHHITRMKDLIENFNIESQEDALLVPELWDTDNGITLCSECHKEEHLKNIR